MRQYRQEKITMHRTLSRLILSTAFLALSLLSGCAVIAVADAVVVTAATVVKTGVKATGAVIGAVIPD
jgi:esterase/lipase superfamily enzyme